MSANPLPDVAPSRYRVTDRDVEILGDVRTFRYVTSAQLNRLHFGHLKVAQRRLRKLAVLGLVTRFRADASVAFGDQRWIYALSRGGARLLGEDGDPAPPPGRTPTAVPYLAHHEVLTDFRIWLREGTARSGGTFGCRFVPAYEEVRDDGRRRRRVALRTGRSVGDYVPDGVFSLDRRDGRAALFVLEVDRGTEPLRRERGTSVSAKLVSFGAAYDEGLRAWAALFERSYQGGRLLWVVPDLGRMEAVLHLAEDFDLPGVVWATVTDNLASPGDLRSPIWTVAGRGERHALSE